MTGYEFTLHLLLLLMGFVFVLAGAIIAANEDDHVSRLAVGICLAAFGVISIIVTTQGV